MVGPRPRVLLTPPLVTANLQTANVAIFKEKYNNPDGSLPPINPNKWSTALTYLFLFVYTWLTLSGFIMMYVVIGSNVCGRNSHLNRIREILVQKESGVYHLFKFKKSL
jgi:hypothetical protein